MTVAPPAECLARSVRRVVFVESSEGGARVVRKEFLARTPLRRLREGLKGWFGIAAAQREARALRALAEAGVRAPRLVDEASTGAGTRRLVQTFVPGDHLVDCLEEPWRRRRILEAIGRQLRQAHLAGWVHNDLHEENVLVEGETPALIDWQRARPDAARDAARVWDVARFEHSMWLLGVPLGDRMRFRRAALGVDRGPAEGEARARLRAVAPVIRRRARQFATARTRRVARAEDGRARIVGRGLRGLRLAEIDEADVVAALAAHTRVARLAAAPVSTERGVCAGSPGAGEVLKRDGRSLVTAVQVGARRLVVRERREPRLRRRVARRLRGSSGRRAFVEGHGLLLRGVATARPFAWLERRRFGLLVGSWVVLEDVRGGWPVTAPLRLPGVDARGVPEPAAPRPSPAHITDALARLLIRLHAADVSTGDLESPQVMLRARRSPNGRFDALLIECDAVRFEAKLDDAARVRDLAALNAAIPDSTLSARSRLRVFDRLARRVPFAAAPDAVVWRVARASLARAQQWRGEDCACGWDR